MNRILDNFLVGLALAASAGYAFSRLGPKSLRTRIWAALAQAVARAPASLKLGGLARRLEAAAAAKSTGACGGCDSCGSEPPSTGKAPASEVRVPLSEIGRRQ
jgi:uncharacterized protein DUF6587